MSSVFATLLDVVYKEERSGMGTPLRFSLPPPLFARFQADFRERATEVGITAIYPGSILGVPVVESADPQPMITTADGKQSPLPLTPEGGRPPCSASSNA